MVDDIQHRVLPLSYDSTGYFLSYFFSELRSMKGNWDAIMLYLEEFSIAEFSATFNSAYIDAELHRRESTVLAYRDIIMRSMKNDQSVTLVFPEHDEMTLSFLISMLTPTNPNLSRDFARRAFWELKGPRVELFEWEHLLDKKLIDISGWRISEQGSRVWTKVLSLLPSLCIASDHEGHKSINAQMFNHVMLKRLDPVEEYLNMAMPLLNNSKKVTMAGMAQLDAGEFTVARVKLHKEYMEFLDVEVIDPVALFAVKMLIKLDRYDALCRYCGNDERRPLSAGLIRTWEAAGFTDFDYIAEWHDNGFGPAQAESWYNRGVQYPDEAARMRDLSPQSWVDKW